jgi:thiamine transport system permease protein
VRICAATLTLVVAAPIAALALRSLRVGGEWTRRGWTLSPVRTAAGLTTGVDLGEALSTSLLVAAVATVTAVLVGVTASLAIDATRRRPTSAGRPLRATITVVTVAPLATSAVMVGLGLLVTFDTSPVDWRQSWWLIPVCHATIATPFVVAICQPTLRAMPDSWLDASSTLGATPARSWRAMQLRRVVRQLPAAAGVAAVISLGDFGASTMLSRTGSPTAPVAVGSLLTRAGDLPRTQGLAGATILAMLCGLCAVAVDRSSEAPT